MKTRAIVILLALFIPVVAFGQAFYTQDFEAMAPTDGAMAGDGWFLYTNVFDAGGGFVGGGGGPAMNNVGNLCDVVTGQGGPNQEMQQLVMYSNYWDGNHGNPGFTIESNLYKEWTVAAGQGVWTFNFDYKMGDLVNPPSEAYAFIKVLNPAAGWSTSVFEVVETTFAPTTWSSGSIVVDLSALAGQIVQIGFLTNSVEYSACGVYYDNIAFSSDGVVPVEGASFGNVKALFR